MVDSRPLMQPFLQAISSFPALPLTVLLGVAVGYWLFSLVTGAHVDGTDAVHGGVKAAGELVAHDGSDHDLSDGGLFAFLGLQRVPVTITFSTAALLSWLLCTVGMLELQPSSRLVQAALLVGSCVLGLFGAALALRPLGRALNADKPARRRDLLGQICTITSGHVDGRFGTASIADGSGGLNVHVICAKSNTLKKGDRAVLIDFDTHNETFEIEPIDWLLPTEIEALNDPARAAQVLSGRVRRR